MNRSELVDAIAEKVDDVSKGKVEEVVRTFEEVVRDQVTGGEKVTLQGFLAFENQETSARKGRNPRTGESVDVPAGKRVKVTAGSTFKNQVKNG